MATTESDSTQALLILDALAQVLDAAEGHMGADWAQMHAGYVRDAAKAVQRDTGITDSQLDNAHAYAQDEWVVAFTNILYPTEQVKDRYEKIRGHAPAPSTD